VGDKGFMVFALRGLRGLVSNFGKIVFAAVWPAIPYSSLFFFSKVENITPQTPQIGSWFDAVSRTFGMRIGLYGGGWSRSSMPFLTLDLAVSASVRSFGINVPLIGMPLPEGNTLQALETSMESLQSQRSGSGLRGAMSTRRRFRFLLMVY